MILRILKLALTLTIFSAIFGLLAQEAFATEKLETPFKNIGTIAKSAGFDKWKNTKPDYTVKVAILDNGFKDHADQIGKSLPESTVYHAGPVAVDPATEESHGLFMAQIVSGLLNYAPHVKYELHLFSAYGYSNLEAAVNQVIADKFDIVLYAQVWEYGGNGDGRGFINTLVNKATDAGILWVNAAGNFGNSTYRTGIRLNDDSWATLPGPNDSVRVRCKKNDKKKCNLRVVLSWSDFSDDVNEGTDKDLDLIVADDTLKIITSSALTQVKEKAEQPGLSLYPREIATTEVKPGLYLLRVKARSKNFVKKDDLRLTVSGDHLELLDKTEGETLLAPADNESVITIGANDSEKSADSEEFKKPELTYPSLMTLKNGEQYKGSSNSSAVAAAALILVKAAWPETSREGAIELLGGSNGNKKAKKPVGTKMGGAPGLGLPLHALQFGPTGEGCFERVQLPYTPPALQPLINDAKQLGLTVVRSTSGIKIFVERDPYSFIGGTARVSPDDMLLVSQLGFEGLPRSNQGFVPFGSYEIVQVPHGQFVCASEEKPSKKSGLKVPVADD